MTESILYTQQNFNADIKSLISQLRDTRFDLIIGINRGGCIAAVCLSHALKVPATMIDYSTRNGSNIHPPSLYKFFEELSDVYSKVLIVDDLIDSGVSIKQVVLNARMFCDVTVATLLYNTDVVIGVDHYYGTAYSRKQEPRFFDFWWEVESGFI